MVSGSQWGHYSMTQFGSHRYTSEYQAKSLIWDKSGWGHLLNTQAGVLSRRLDASESSSKRQAELEREFGEIGLHSVFSKSGPEQVTHGEFVAREEDDGRNCEHADTWQSGSR